MVFFKGYEKNPIVAMGTKERAKEYMTNFRRHIKSPQNQDATDNLLLIENLMKNSTGHEIKLFLRLPENDEGIQSKREEFEKAIEYRDAIKRYKKEVM